MLDNAGGLLKEDRVRSTDQALVERFGTLPSTRFVVETGTHSPWVSRLLTDLGHSVVVANARKLRMICESNRKNDRLDARMLARLGRFCARSSFLSGLPVLVPSTGRRVQFG